MKNAIQNIKSYLIQEGFEVVAFNEGGVSEDFLSDEPTELIIRVDEDALPKWEYFTERLNRDRKTPIAKGLHNDGLYKFIFIGSNDEFGREELVKTLEEFHTTLQRKFYKVLPKTKRFNVLVKPTHRCNLDCKYCYDKPFRETIHCDMPMATLDRIAHLISEHCEEIQWIWHGGEPTMVGTKWFEQAHDEILSKYPMLDFEFSVMSNGTNFSDEWLALFKKYNIQVGTSYNGKFQVDLRVANQKHENREKNQQMADKLGAILKDWNSDPDKIKVGVIDVITGMNYKDQIEIYEFYKTINTQVAMNHIFHTRQTEANGLELSGEEYGKAFIKYFKHWLHDTEGYYERSAGEMLTMVIGGRSNLTCTHTDCRHRWLGFNPLGEMYPCDRWYPEKYKIGNVFDFETIEEVYEAEPYRLYVNDVAERFEKHCKPCGHWETCRGGCNASAIESSGSGAGIEPFYCDLYRYKYKWVYDALRDIDIVHDENLNPHARTIMIDNGFYSIKDVKTFTGELGIEFDLDYDPNDLLSCSEHQIFRGINYIKDHDQSIGRHVDHIMDQVDIQNVKKNEEVRRKDLMIYLKEIAAAALKE